MIDRGRPHDWHAHQVGEASVRANCDFTAPLMASPADVASGRVREITSTHHSEKDRSLRAVGEAVILFPNNRGSKEFLVLNCQAEVGRTVSIIWLTTATATITRRCRGMTGSVQS